MTKNGLKKSLLLALLIVAMVFLGLTRLKPFVYSKITRSIERSFPGASVSYENVHLSFPLRVTLSGLKIEDKTLSALIPAITLDMDSQILTKHVIKKVTFINPLVTIRSQENLSRFADGGSANSAKAFSLGELEVRDLKLDYNCDGISASAGISLFLDMRHGAVKSLNISVPLVKGPDFELEAIGLQISAQKVGSFSIRQARYQKIKLSDIKGAIGINGDEINLSSLTARLTDGSLTGSARVALDKTFSYSAELRIAALGLPALMKDLELDKKVDVSGVLIGRISLQGHLNSVDTVEGSLEVSGLGGDLVIKDPSFLENLAKNTKQPLTIIEASFKEYHFDTGGLTLTKRDKNLGLAIHLNGPKGKRDLDVSLHDLF